MTQPRTIVIVGAGQTGAVAAAELRRNGYDGKLVLLGRETHLPYERPPLSKAALEADSPAAQEVHPASFYADQNIEVRTGTDVLSLDPTAHVLTLAGGEQLSYDRCLLATGGDARPWTGLPRGTPGIHYIRTLDDARGLQATLVPGKQVAIIGAGFLGLEVASTCTQRGVPVTLIDTGTRLLARALPPGLSAWLQTRVAAMHVQLQLGQGISSIDASATTGHRFRVTLGDGTQVTADDLVVAIGLVPHNELAIAAGLAVQPDGGIRVDDHCRTSADDVYAAGDCASRFRVADGSCLRLESWQNANEQGRIAAWAMLGLDPVPSAFPWFWTDQFGCNVQILGMPEEGLTYVVRGTDQFDAPRMVWLGHRAGVPVHGVAINAGNDLRALRPLFDRQIPIDLEGYADTQRPLKALAKSCLEAAASRP